MFTAEVPATLPTAGEYCFVAETTDNNGVLLNATFAVGSTASAWEASPLTGIPTMQSIVFPSPLRADGYIPGETVKVGWDSLYSSATVLVVWGANNANRNQSHHQEASHLKRKIVTLASPGSHNITFALGDECAHGGCGVMLLAVTPRDPVAYAPLSELPTSKVYDPSLPQAYTSGLLSIPISQPVRSIPVIL